MSTLVAQLTSLSSTLPTLQGTQAARRAQDFPIPDWRNGMIFCPGTHATSVAFIIEK